MGTPFRTVPNPQNLAGAPAGRQDTPPRDSRVVAIDELVRKSADERSKYLGDRHFLDIVNLYNLEDIKVPSPTFRPKVLIPQLQVLMMNEATDLTDNDPRIYIIDQRTGSRDRTREQALMAQWHQGFFNNEILAASLWALLAGVGYLQVYHDPTARNGQGAVLIKSRDPESVYPDPAATNDRDWSYLVWEDPMYLDEVRRRWPEHGWEVKPKVRVHDEQTYSGNSFQLPPGPMSVMPGVANSAPISTEYKVKVRYAWLRDATVEEIPAEERSVLYGAKPKRRMKYPDGRLIISAEDVVLFDDNNPFPKGYFPLIRLTGLPVLRGFYGPPPTRYTSNLQDLAQRMYTQIFENAVRLNNGIVVVNEQSGINLDNFGGIPGEVLTASFAGGQPITILYPSAGMPAQMIQLPQVLLEQQRMLQGFTPVRTGEPSAGNISPSLYDMAVQQSQKMTKLRGRLMAQAVQKLAELVFYTMAKFYKLDQTFIVPRDPEGDEKTDAELFKWTAIADNWNRFEVQLDPGSIRPVSGAALRMMVPTLKQLGMLSTETGLEMLEFPGAKEEAQKVSDELKLAALAGVQARRK